MSEEDWDAVEFLLFILSYVGMCLFIVMWGFWMVRQG